MLEIPFFTKPFAALDHSDLRELVEVKRVREHLQLDYKLASYEHGREGTIEMLADVTAMANASGGYIIVGVAEDPSEDDGTPKEIVGISNGDKEAIWVQSVCETAIDEKIIGLRIQDISIGDDKSCVVIYVPNSLRKPHMINYQKHYSVRMRNDKAKRFLDMREIRTMILSMNQYQYSLKDFLKERCDDLKQAFGDKPWMLVMATPIYVDSDKFNPVGNDDLLSILTNPPRKLDRSLEGIRMDRSPQPRIYGVESPAFIPTTKELESFLRLFRNGHLEFGESLERYHPFTNGKFIEAYKLTVILINFLDTMKEILRVGQIYEPLTITMYWSNIRGSSLMERAGHKYPYSWNSNDLLIQATVNDLSDTHAIAHQLLDRLYNAFGMDECPHFDQPGKFIGVR